MADNPADQETMRSSARFFAEAIDIHREHHSSQDAVAYNQLHEDLEIDLSEGAAKLQERFNWLEKDLRLYADADEISADDKEGLLRYTQRVIETAVELSAMRSEYAALGVFLKKGPKEGALEADQILNKGDLFAKLKIPENLREWFGENILAPTLAKEFSARKDVGQETLKQVNSNIRTIERWNLAEGEAHLSRYAAQVKFYQDKKNADAVKEAEDRYKKLSRKLEDETRDLFKDQVINGVRRHGELKILYKLADNPAIGRQSVAEVAESAPAVPEIEIQSKPALVERQEVPKPTAIPKPADSVTSTLAPDLTKGISAAPASVGETATQTVEPQADATVTTDPKTGYETALQILHKKGLALNSDYSAEAAEETLKKFVKFYLPLKSDDRIAPDDVDNLDSLALAAELYHRAEGDFEKMISPELLEDVLFTTPPPLTPSPTTSAGGSGTGSEVKTDTTGASTSDSKPNSPVVAEAGLKTFADMTKNLDYDALVKQMSDKARDGKLPAMDILALLDEELNPESGYNHALAKQNMYDFLKNRDSNPDQDVRLGDHETMRGLARLALAYKLSNGDSEKLTALYGPGSDKEKAVIDDSVSSFANTLAKYHKKEELEPVADLTGPDPASTKPAGADSAVTPPQTQDGLLNPDNLNWGYLLGGTAAATTAALVIRKMVKSRSATAESDKLDKKDKSKDKSKTKSDAKEETKAKADDKAGEKKSADADDAKAEKTATKTGEDQTKTARAQAGTGTEPEEATRSNTNGNGVRPGQAQAVIDEGLSPEMEAVLRENVALKERDLKTREEKLDKLKFKHRTLEKEYVESPQKNTRTEELLKAWEKDIKKKQENIENLRREIYDTESKLAGRPRPQAARVSRPAAATAARTATTDTAEPVVRRVADVIPDDNGTVAKTVQPTGAVPDTDNVTTTERPAQPVRAAPGNSPDGSAPKTPPAPDTLNGTAPKVAGSAVVPKDATIVKPVQSPVDANEGTSKPAAGAPGNAPEGSEPPKPKVVPPAKNPASKSGATKLGPEFHENVGEMQRQVGLLEEPFKPAAIETLLDERDIPRLPRAEVAMDAYNEASLRERARAIYTEERGLRAQKDELETKYREIEKREAKLRSKTNVFEEETREERRERKKLEKLTKEYGELNKKYDERVERHKADVESLAKDREGHTQRGADLDTQEAKLKKQQDALNEKFADFEKEKHTLPSHKYEHRWRDLAKQRVDLHAKGMTLAEQRAYHEGMQFQSLSERPGAPSTVNIRGAFNQTNVTRGLGVGGIGLGGYGLYKSVEAGDTAGVTINTGNILTGGAALWHTASTVVPKPITFIATRLNVPMIFATGAYQIYSEKGDFIETNADGGYSLGDRGARTLAVAATVTTGVITTVAGVAAAPAVILVGSAAIVGETALEMRHSYRAHEEVNRLNKEAAQAKITTGSLDRDKSGVPVVRNYSSLTVFAIDYAKKTNVQDPYEHVNKTDYSDPKTLRKLEKALDKQIAELQKTIKDNDSVVPDWMRIVGTDSANKKAIAERELAPLEAARRELEIFKQDVAAHKKHGTQNSALFTSWSRANEQLRDAAKGGFDALILNGFNRDGDRNLSVDEIKAALVNSGIKTRAEIDTDHDDIISHKELEEALRRGLDGVKDLVKGQFAGASTPEDNTPVGAGGGPKMKPGK